jgi:hypothetical protein
MLAFGTTVYTSPRPYNCAAGTLVVGEGVYENALWTVLFAGLWELLNCASATLLPLLPVVAVRYRTLLYGQRALWNIKFVNTCFACAVVPLALYCVYVDEALQRSPLNGTSAVVRFAANLTAGFFVWDTYVVLKYYNDWGPQYLLHAAFCLVTYATIALGQIGVTNAFCALFYEASTPFLNIRWFMRQLLNPEKHHEGRLLQLWQLNNVLFVVVFVGVRFVYGSYLTYSVLRMVRDETCLPTWTRVSSTVSIGSSYVLNTFWTTLVVRNAMRAAMAVAPEGVAAAPKQKQKQKQN